MTLWSHSLKLRKWKLTFMQKHVHEYSCKSPNRRKWFSVSFLKKRTVVDSDSRRKGQTVGKPYCLVESHWRYCVKEMLISGFLYVMFPFCFLDILKTDQCWLGFIGGKGCHCKRILQGILWDDGDTGINIYVISHRKLHAK